MSLSQSTKGFSNKLKAWQWAAPLGHYSLNCLSKLTRKLSLFNLFYYRYVDNILRTMLKINFKCLKQRPNSIPLLITCSLIYLNWKAGQARILENLDSSQDLCTVLKITVPLAFSRNYLLLKRNVSDTCIRVRNQLFPF